MNDRSTDVEDLAVDYYRLTNRFPGPKVTPWLDRIEAEFGYTAASRALAEQVIANSEPHTLLGRVDAVLKTAQRNAAKAGQLAEKAKLEKWAEEHSITPEQAAENQRRVAEVRQEMFGSMLDRQAPFGAARKEATG